MIDTEEKNKNENNREFKILDDRSHVLLRPNMYIGAVTLTQREQWFFDIQTNKFVFKNISYIPGLDKCINEIIDNCIDVAIETNFQKISKISVEISDTWFRVTDNGPGIPVKSPKTIDSKNRLCPEIAWTVKQAGTSFSENRKGPSANGVGSTCVNIFSKKFIGISDDGNKMQKIECLDNMSIINASKPMKSSGKSGVDVYVEPDLPRFGIEKITEEHKSLIYQRLLNLAICFPKLKFYFNKQLIKINENNFAKMFSENSIVHSSKNTKIVVFPNEYDEFKQYSYVNGLNCIRGGTQIDYVCNELCNRIRDKLIKKYKTIRPGDIKNRICLVVFITDFENAQFDAQTKELLSNSVSDIKKHINDKINFDEFAKEILKNESIINPIIDMFKLKEELKSRNELKQIKKIKVRSDKYMAPIGEKKYLALCEGASAMSGISGCIGRKEIGYYACRGLAINVFNSSMQKIAANQEFKDIMNILELDITKETNENKKIAFDKIMFTTDSDADASHICSMFLGWFARFAPNLFTEKKICRLVTPLIIIQDNKGKIVKYFLSLSEFKEYEKSKNKINGKLTYLKGLGSWEKADLQYLIDTYGFDNFVFYYNMDEDGKIYLKHWLVDEEVEKRKEYIKNFDFDINAV